jgi:BirA family biotin operon repressor/biotin-[acetyl-CoA-carboxylase] ligase
MAGRVTAVRIVGRVGSTQDVARELAAAGAADGTLVVAERQESGRGRAGRAWDDEARPGASLAATLVVAPPGEPSLVPHAAGIAVLRALAPWPVIPAALKWPNDVVVRVDGTARKIAGILVERVADGSGDRLLVGIGINVDRRGLEEMADRTGVADLAGVDVAPSRLLAALVVGLDEALGLLDASPSGLLRRYRSRCDTVDREVEVTLPDGAILRGRGRIDDAGRLELATSEGQRTVIAGTVRDVVTATRGGA